MKRNIAFHGVGDKVTPSDARLVMLQHNQVCLEACFVVIMSLEACFVVIMSLEACFVVIMSLEACFFVIMSLAACFVVIMCLEACFFVIMSLAACFFVIMCLAAHLLPTRAACSSPLSRSFAARDTVPLARLRL